MLVTRERGGAAEPLHKEYAGEPVVRMLRDAPELGSLPPHVLRVLAGCYRYHENAPSRDEVMRAMTSLASPKRGVA